MSMDYLLVHKSRAWICKPGVQIYTGLYFLFSDYPAGRGAAKMADTAKCANVSDLFEQTAGGDED